MPAPRPVATIGHLAQGMFPMGLDQQSLEKRLNACIGIPMGPQRSWDPVNQAMIRHWCDAMGDTNPLYTDPVFAAGSRHQGVIAPPTMIQAWTMPGYTNRLAPGSGGRPENLENYFELLSEAGYISVVAVNCEQTYFKNAHLGDAIYNTKALESVSDRKQTALGEGYFITELWTFFNQHDEKVAEMRFRLLKFKAPSAS
ncbi:MAG: hypothetical protein EP312_11115 [Gammaproteobacteria bacterium]|nr:MAG: hypothetical protein EP312_11115 [Gammaproteobacteria bacterium]